MAKDPTEAPDRVTFGERLNLTLKIIRAHPTGRVALKVFIAVLGGLVIAVGAVLIPLPGPGWLIVIGGLAIWAVEFVWARHLLKFTRDKLKLWTTWVGRQTLAMRLLIGLAGLIFVAAVVTLTFKLSFDVNLPERIWQYITTHSMR